MSWAKSAFGGMRFSEGRLSVSVNKARRGGEGYTIYMNDEPACGYNKGYSHYVDTQGKVQTYQGSGWESDMDARLDRLGCLHTSYEDALAVAERFVETYKATRSTKPTAAHEAALKAVRDHDWAHDGCV